MIIWMIIMFMEFFRIGLRTGLILRRGITSGQETRNIAGFQSDFNKESG
jgi:hypothetical protein